MASMLSCSGGSSTLARLRRHIELGGKGPQDAVDAVFAVMPDGLSAMGAEFEEQ